jgi:hypothetical protein
VRDGVHILRHSFCSHLAMRGAPARAIQELAGHKDLSMTQRHMHLSPAALDAAIRLLDFPQGRSGLETGWRRLPRKEERSIEPGTRSSLDSSEVLETFWRRSTPRLSFTTIAPGTGSPSRLGRETQEAAEADNGRCDSGRIENSGPPAESPRHQGVHRLPPRERVGTDDLDCPFVRLRCQQPKPIWGLLSIRPRGTMPDYVTPEDG